MCTALLLVLGEIPLPPDNILQPPEHRIQQILQIDTHEASTPLVCMASSVEVAACLDFSCVWLAFVLMLTIVRQPKAANFCLASFLAKTK